MAAVRVLSHPPRHPYVDRLGEVVDLVHRHAAMPRLEDFHRPSWIRAHAEDWDLVHLHFGHEQYSVARIVEVVRTHQDLGTPVVVTAHDLQVPHLTAGDPRAAALLRAIGPEVDALLTLTEGAADRVRQLARRPVGVVPHGPLLPHGRRAAMRAARERWRCQDRPLLLHAGTLRPNLAWGEVLCAHGRNPVRPLLVTVAASRAAPVLAAAHGRPGVQVRTYQGRLGHTALEGLLARSHALVLPYTHGTHSGMVELAADIGVPVIATAVGHLAEQHPLRTVPLREGRPDVTALAAAMGEDLDHLVVPDDLREVAGQRMLRVHRTLYDVLCHEASVGTGAVRS